MTRRHVLFLTALTIASSGTARTELLFSSLDSPPDWSHSVNTPLSITNRHLAAGFTTGDSGALIDGMRLSLWNPNTDAEYFTLPVRFYDDNAGQPGSSLGIFAYIYVLPRSYSSDPSDAKYYAATGDRIELAAHRTYWLVLEALEDTPFPLSMLWSTSTGAYDSGEFSSRAQPSKFYSENFDPAFHALNGAGDFQFSLEGTSIPEPGTMSLALIGALGLLSRRRRLP